MFSTLIDLSGDGTDVEDTVAYIDAMLRCLVYSREGQHIDFEQLVLDGGSEWHPDHCRNHHRRLERGCPRRPFPGFGRSHERAEEVTEEVPVLAEQALLLVSPCFDLVEQYLPQEQGELSEDEDDALTSSPPTSPTMVEDDRDVANDGDFATAMSPTSASPTSSTTRTIAISLTKAYAYSPTTPADERFADKSDYADKGTVLTSATTPTTATPPGSAVEPRARNPHSLRHRRIHILRRRRIRGARTSWRRRSCATRWTPRRRGRRPAARRNARAMTRRSTSDRPRAWIEIDMPVRKQCKLTGAAGGATKRELLERLWGLAGEFALVTDWTQDEQKDAMEAAFQVQVAVRKLAPVAR